MPGVGQVNVSGGARPAVRVDAYPDQLNSYGISLEQVRTALANANANRPKGVVSNGLHSWQINTTDQLFTAKEYRPLVIAWRHGAAVRLSDVANVTDSVENFRNAGVSNGVPATLMFINRQPGANIVDTVDRIRAILPELQASISPSIHIKVVNDRTTTIRSSIHDVEITLLVSIVLVVLVVFVFLRNAWATAIPSISVPLSLVGTFGVMYLLGYTLDNLSLMALTISTGFVVDDAIVVIENITRHLEAGMRPFQAALQGSREIGFTVVSMSTSLIAVFIPILLMAGIVGRLFREFAVIFSIAIAMSLLVSLTTTPMMCAQFPQRIRTPPLYVTNFSRALLTASAPLRYLPPVGLRRQPVDDPGATSSLRWSADISFLCPIGFFPQQDTGRFGGIIGGSSTSRFPRWRKDAAFKIVQEDPAIETVMAFSGGGSGATRACSRSSSPSASGTSAPIR